MATKAVFNFFNHEGEQKLLHDLTTESIQQYGHDVWYVARTVDSREEVLNEAETASYNAAYPIEMYVKTVDHMGGEGALLMKFGLQEYDELTFTISRRTFRNLVTLRDSSIVRPREGDLIFVPMIGAAFRIRFVDKKAFFYQMGDLQAWDVVAELYEASSETFDTGVPLIDDIYQLITNRLEDIVLNTEAGDLLQAEDGWYLEWSMDDELVPDMDDSLTMEEVSDEFLDWDEANPFGAES